MPTFTLYIIDDEPSIRRGITLGFQNDYTIFSFGTAKEAIDELKQNPPDLILLDIGLPDMNGIEALKRIRSTNSEVLVIILTAYEDAQTIISVMKLGVYDYVVKPLQIDSLSITIKNALDSIRMRKKIQELQYKYLNEHMPYSFIGQDSSIQHVMQAVKKVSKSTDTPVLILGESGTGKELIACAIHYQSMNFNKPFITVNCAAIPSELVESELFGYEKGAFTGATSTGKKGLIEQSDGGTLFLDEVADLKLDCQAKLLRFLENGEFYKVGSTEKRVINSRVISATNKDLDVLIEKGLFRQDLFFRLAVFCLKLPSLNRRPNDIIPLSEYFLTELSKKHHKLFKGISKDAQGFLKDYHWKGNIRELRNIIERAVIVSEGDLITLENLTIDHIYTPKIPCTKEPSTECFPPLPEQGIDLEALETHYLKEALQKSDGNMVEAAKLLNMSYYTFRYRIKKKGVDHRFGHCLEP